MRLIDLKVDEFVNDLASKKPVPGGGGAAALCGSLGAALGSMAANFTSGKKKYAEYEEDIQRILSEMEPLIERLKLLVDVDAAAFEPLSRAYSMPVETEEQKSEKERVMQECLKKACAVPLEALRVCVEVLALLDELSYKASKLIVSDVGVGAQLIRAAISASVMNITVNLKDIKDEEFFSIVIGELSHSYQSSLDKCDEVFNRVFARLK